MTHEQPSAAQKLCNGCGMCCDGVMFYSVELQETDSESELKSLGLRVKVKKKQAFIPQPCQAHNGCACSIYENRPQRCRLFNCRQLLQVEAGEKTLDNALLAVNRTRALADTVLELLLKAGSTNLKRSLRTRYELVLSQPEEGLPDESAKQIRASLIKQMEELEAILAADFRV